MKIKIPSIHEWKFDKYYTPINEYSEFGNMIYDSRSLIEDCKIEQHPFFHFARRESFAIIEWAKQECIISNHFSFALFAMFARIENVHIRSLLIPVVTGEHSPLNNGIAFHSHPHLLSKLVIDLDVPVDEVRPIPFTVDFINLLFCKDKSIPFTLGLLGIGNEALLIPEYTAVENTFKNHFCADVFSPFLKANIEEDKIHCRLMEQAAISLVRDRNDCVEYIKGAREGIKARIDYYDQLLNYVKNQESDLNI